MKKILLLLTFVATAASSFSDETELFWVEGDKIFPTFETIFISSGLAESWDASNQLDWAIGRQDILDRLNYSWTSSVRAFSAVPWLYERKGSWSVLIDKVALKSLLAPELARDYALSLDPSLIDSVELIHGAASYLYGPAFALGAINISLPCASCGDRLGGTNELVGRVTTLEREQSAWWRAALLSQKFSAIGEIAGREWENEFSSSFTREQFIRIAGLASSNLSLSGSFFARHINNLESNLFLADFDSQQASVNLDYGRSGSGITDVYLALLGIDLRADEDSASSIERWQWVGGRAISGFQTGWTLQPIIGFEGFWERARFDEVEEGGGQEADAALGAGFVLIRFQPTSKFELATGFRYDVAQNDDSQYEFISPSLKASYAPSEIWNFIASYDHSDGGGEEYDIAWDSWKLGVKISDERVRSVLGVGYIDSEADNPYSFGRMRIFLGYNWRFDFSTAWIRWDEDYHHLFGHCAVRFAGTEHDWWVEWVSAYASNRELSGFFWRHDLFARFRFFKYLSLRAGVENIFDKRYFIELMEFEPRNYKFQLEFAFGI